MTERIVHLKFIITENPIELRKNKSELFDWEAHIRIQKNIRSPTEANARLSFLQQFWQGFAGAKVEKKVKQGVNISKTEDATACS